MPRPGDRRPLITDHAIAVLAEGGARALTHHAVDRHAALPTGSTSYYFRTRASLVAATIARIREHSRAEFDAAAPMEPAAHLTVESAAALMEDQLLILTSRRRDQALAVFALLTEVEKDQQHRSDLAGCLFSLDLAAGLVGALGGASAEHDARDLIDFLTGLLFDLLFGARKAGGAGQRPIRLSLARFLDATLR